MILQMKIIEKKLIDIIPYENNPRNNDGAVDAVAASLILEGYLAFRGR